MMCGNWLLALLILGCSDPKVGSDSDDNTTTNEVDDTGTDLGTTDGGTTGEGDDTGVTVPAEDCYDGEDNDGDGMLDCEDGDCVDTCMEDCQDKFDNDVDGFTDCDDDECIGAEGCPAGYEMSAVTQILSAGLAAGPSVYAVTSSWNTGFAYGYVDVVATPWDSGDEGFLCQGFFYVLPEDPYASYDGFSWHTGDTGADCAGCDVHIDLNLSAASGNLYWFDVGDPCPVQTLPTAHLGFRWNQPTISRRLDAAWSDWYATAPEEILYSNSYLGEGATTLQWMYQMESKTPYSWTGYYDLD